MAVLVERHVIGWGGRHSHTLLTLCFVPCSRRERQTNNALLVGVFTCTSGTREGRTHESSLLEPRRLVSVGSLQLDVELLERRLERRLVAGEVRGHGVVEQEQLLVHHLHLKKQENTK